MFGFSASDFMGFEDMNVTVEVEVTNGVGLSIPVTVSFAMVFDTTSNSTLLATPDGESNSGHDLKWQWC